MIKSGLSHLVTFVVSLIVGHAVLILLGVYAPKTGAFFLRSGETIAHIFKISYPPRTMAAFIIAAILSFFFGIILPRLFKR